MRLKIAQVLGDHIRTANRLYVVNENNELIENVISIEMIATPEETHAIVKLLDVEFINMSEVPQVNNTAPRTSSFVLIEPLHEREVSQDEGTSTRRRRRRRD